MKILTKKEFLKGVAERWLKQYPKNYIFPDGDSSGEKHSRLLKLEPLTAKGIDKIIGNDKWTKLKCDKCEKNFNIIVCLKEKIVCRKCLKKIRKGKEVDRQKWLLV